MQISHECPISLLEESLKFNDYCYALVHLFETHPEYYNHYRRSVLMGRTVILDNSCFELNRSFSASKFAKWVEKLQPEYSIVPDVLENYQETVWNYEDFLREYKNLPTKFIGVVQGKNYQEITDCYKALVELGCSKIAISFDYSWFQTLFPQENKLVAWMKGRKRLIDMMLNDGIIQKSLPHHLLGISLPQGVSDYKSKDYSFIKSLDTSNPVVHGLFLKKYYDYGLDDKVSMKLCNMIDRKPTESQLEIINYNIKKFREFSV
jgi:hypothetical protein